MIDSGINQFDVASIEEIKQIRKFSHTAKCSFMHTVKSPESINESYFKYGIKSFSLDTKEELIKELSKTNISCKDVSFTIMGLSLASINTIFSLF